jgi:Excalibur calcium-binding domain
VRRLIVPLLLSGCVALGAIVWGVAQVPAAMGASAIPYLWKNCTHVHTKYRHGVGRRFAHDHTSGTAVTNFYRSTRLYKIAIGYNKRLDADKDGIACEQH